MSREAKIGVFLGGAILIMAVFISVVGDMSTWFRKPGYEIFAHFTTVTGLEKNAAVRLAGVKIGYVKEIRLAERKARLVLSISPEHSIPRGSKATLASLGLVGEKYIEILPGEEPGSYQAGETIEARTTVGLDQLGDMALSIGEDVKQVAGSLRRLTSDETTRDIQAALRNLASASRELDQFLAENRGRLQAGIRSAAAAAEALDVKFAEAAENLAGASRLLRETVGENRELIRDNMSKLESGLAELERALRLIRETLEKINRGEGTLGKLAEDPDLYEEARETLGAVRKAVAPVSRMRAVGSYRADYLGRTEKFKSYLSAGFYLAPRAFLLGQVVDDPRAEEFRFSLQTGMRFGSFSPRAGVIESELGAGVDYFAFDDRLMFSLEGYDFRRDGGPQLRFTAQFALLKYVHLLVGLDDFGRSSSRQAFFGLGLGTR